MTMTHMPETIDIQKDVKFKRKLAFQVPLEVMTRVLESTPKSFGVADVLIQFDKDVQGHAYIDLEVQVTIVLECQRCLKDAEFPLVLKQRLSPVDSAAEARELAEGVEPVQTVDGLINVKDIVEDEILLAIPMHPKHDALDCEVSFKETKIEEERQMPFTNLAALFEEEQAE